MLDGTLESFLSSSPTSDASILISRAEKVLAEALLAGSSRPVRAAVAFLKLKYHITYQQLVPIAELLWALFETSKSNIYDETEVALALTSVLKLLNKLSDCPPLGSTDRIKFSWRPLYDALLRVQLHGSSEQDYSLQPTSEVPVGGEARKAHGQAMVGLIRRARNFFPTEAASEIIRELRPFLCPHETSHYRATGLLCLMLPEQVDDAIIQELLRLWNSLTNCLEWTYLWTLLFSRLARHSNALVIQSLQMSLPQIFENFLFMLNLPSSKDNPQRPELLTWPSDCAFLLTKTCSQNEVVKKMTRLMVFTLAPQSVTWSLLDRLVLYLKPFFHPLNEGAWTSALDMLLKMLTINFSKRLGFESGCHRVKRVWSPLSAISDKDKTKFVELIHPIALVAFESKDYSMSFGAAQALKDLVSICPDVVLPTVIERLIPGIENTLKPHEALNSMEAFSVLLSGLLRSEGGMESPVIAEMLQLTLAGIDNNDPMKTLKTLRMYHRVVTLIPLIHPSDLPASKPEWVFILPDWTTEVIDRIWKFLGNVPSIKKGSGLESVLGQNSFSRFVDTYFQQMSPTLFEMALKQLCQRVSSTYYPPGKKYFGQMINAAVYASGSSLREVIPLLVGKILQKNNVDLVGSASESSYWVHLLGHAVARGADHNLPFASVLDQVLEAVVLHEDKELRQEGQKLLRKLLRSHLLVYPVDFRSLPSAEWNFPVCTDISRVVHPCFVPSKADIKFTVPSDESKHRVQIIVDRYFSLMKCKLLSKESAPSPSELRCYFGCLEALVRGAAAIMPETVASFKNIIHDNSEFPIEESEGSVELPCQQFLPSSDWGKNLRENFSDLLNQLCLKHAVRENPDVAGVKGLTRVLQFFLSFNGFKAFEHDPVNYNKAVYRLWSQGLPGTYTRGMLVQKAHALLYRRLSSGAWAMTPKAEVLLGHLLALCTHEYSLVRKKAQKSLPKVLARYPRFADQVLSLSLKMFCQDSSKSTVNGAIFTLNTSVMLKRCVRQWGHTSDFIVGMLSARQFQDLKVQVRLAELWSAFVPHTCCLGFAHTLSNQKEITQRKVVVKHFSPSQAEASVIAGINASSALRSKQSQIYGKLISAIENHLQDIGKLHWRYTLLAASAMSILLRREVDLPPSILDFFIGGLVSEVLPLRELCRTVLPSIMSFFNKPMTIDGSKDRDMMETECTAISFKYFDTPLSVQSWDGPFVDCLWRGWNGSINSSAGQETPSSLPLTPQGFKSWIDTPELVNRFCELISSDHRLSGDERALSADKSAPGMQLPSAVVLSLFGSAWCWPRTSAAPFSTAFNKRNVLAIETITRFGGRAILDAFLRILQSTISNFSDREQQCLASELFAGVVRGILLLDGIQKKEIEAQVESIIGKNWQNFPPEAAGDWMDSLRLIVTNRDPRRFQWLARIVSSLIPSSDCSTTLILNGLKLQQALLIEFGWKGYSFASSINNQLHSLLAGSSKAVREEAARCLVLTSRIDSCLSSSSNVLRPNLEDDNSYSRELLLNQFPAYCRRLTESYASTSVVRSSENLAWKAIQHEIEGILYFFIHAGRLGQTSSTSSFLRDVIPLMISVQEDSDREFSQIGKTAIQLVCSMVDDRDANNVFKCASTIHTQASSWRVRSGAIEAIHVIAHKCVLDVALQTLAIDFFKQALADQTLDVRTYAQLCLAGLLRMAKEETIILLISGAPKPRRRVGKIGPGGEGEENLALRHGKVLAIAAAILSHPTDLPEWMANAMSTLCSLSDEDPVIKQSIIHTIGEFKKTHQDMLPLISLTWSPDQLSQMNDFAGARSYYS